ncbi:sensor histidine kinase [Pseudonocardia yuanmonensis]|uniref:sensor histidine kinase n=1 Tax=Pseudonocardia yuanmonensis TaxID=1095914 RepID=UPI0031EBD79E
MREPAGGQHPGYRHDVVLFGSDADLAAASREFIVDGIAAGDLVLVHGPEHEVEVLRASVGDDPRVVFTPNTGRYQHMMATVGQYQRLCAQENAAGRRVRSSGVVPLGPDPASQAEWMRYEALVGRVLGPFGFYGQCRYDTRTTPPALLDLALATHEHVVTAEGTRPGPRARTAADVLDQLARPDRHPLESGPALVGLLDCRSPAAARRAVQHALREAGVERERAQDFVAAVNEVVSNALQHGRPPVGVNLHRGDGQWLCVVTDRGPGVPDPWTGVDAPLAADRTGVVGSGLWLARQLCHDLVIGARPGGGARVALFLDCSL